MKFVKVETEQAYYTNRNAWNAMAFEKEVAFWEVAIFKHAKQYFPHVRGSDWLYTKWTSDYWCDLPAACYLLDLGLADQLPAAFVPFSDLCMQSDVPARSIPDPESNMFCRTPGHTGAVPGGDANGFSTTMMYDNFNEGGPGHVSWAQDAIPYVLKEFFGVKDGVYPKTPFNTIRINLMQGRSMVLGGRAGASPPGNHLRVPMRQ
jgi:hypothetical protein